MDQFVSYYMLRLDAKGRVSVPAAFRAVLARDGFDGLYCYPALDRPALDAGGNVLLAEIQTLIAGYPWFGDWGRDTMIALPGLTLGTGRAEVARSILQTFACHVDQILFPPAVYTSKSTSPVVAQLAVKLVVKVIGWPAATAWAWRACR